MEKWEHEAHASEYSGQGSEYRCSSWSWDTWDLSDKEIFARLTHESTDESENICGPYWAAKPVNSSGISLDTLKHIDDGWGALCEPPPVPPGLLSKPQSSWQPFPDANTSRSSWPCRRYEKQQSAHPAGSLVVIEPLEVPALSEGVPVPLKRALLKVVHPVQCGIVPKRVALPRPDDEILSLVTTRTSSPYEAVMLLGKEFSFP